MENKNITITPNEDTNITITPRISLQVPVCLQLLFIALKVCKEISWSWGCVFSPVWYLLITLAVNLFVDLAKVWFEIND